MINGSCAEEIKGMISYPCCPKHKVMAYASARGRVSSKCPNCGKFVTFDYDLMTVRRHIVGGADRTLLSV